MLKYVPVKKNPAVAKSSGFCDSLLQPLNVFNRALNELYFRWKATLWALTPKPWISIGSPISTKYLLIHYIINSFNKYFMRIKFYKFTIIHVNWVFNVFEISSENKTSIF